MFLPLGHLNKDAESKASDIEDELGKAVSSKQQFSPKQTSISPVEDKFTSALTEGPIWMGTKTDTVLTPLNRKEVAKYVEDLQEKLKDGWTVHAGQDGRLFYCNHITQTAGWLPPCENWNHSDVLPYGWERAIDSKGRAYFINHLNKTSTYEAPDSVRWEEQQPATRVVVLQRSPDIGFGFVAGSERPVIVRFVTEGSSSMNKLQPGDQILAVNNEDVKEAPRDHVIQLVRACESQVTLLVCQPANINRPGRKSTLLSAGKRAKLRSRPSRVRFAESVCVNGAPLFPPSAFSLGDICVPPMANVLKVFLENGQTKSFKYDATTTVQDVVSSLYDKLCIHAIEHFMLALEHIKSLKRNKLTFLDPEESLAKIASRPGAHKLRCLFRVAFVPTSAAELARKDQNALDYLFMQCCNDVTQDRFSSELHPETSLRLAALHMHQHALANNVSPVKLTVKIVEKEFGLERFMSSSLLEGMKRKELRRLIGHFLKANSQVTGSPMRMLTQLQAKIHYLDIISGLPSYGAKCFSTNQREGIERVLLVSPRFGLSQIPGVKNSVPQRISAIEDCVQVTVSREDDIICTVDIFILGDRVVKFSMEDRDASEFSLVLSGYYRLFTGKNLPIDKERETYDEDNAPSYLAQHTVLASTWSYVLPFLNDVHSINFLLAPPYHSVEQLSKSSSIKAKSEKSSPLQRSSEITENSMSADCSNQFDRNFNPTAMSKNSYNPSHSTLFNGGTGSNCLSHTLDLDIHSVMAMELLEEAKDSGLSDSSGGGSNSAMYCPALNGLIEARNEGVLRRVAEMQKMVENSEQYLNEQCEECDEMEKEAYFSLQSHNKNSSSYRPSLNIDTGTIEYFDSDCDSLNSSKVSSNEDAPSSGILKHSDSLVLLAEAINQDLSGIAKGLNFIDGSIKKGTNSGTENLSASTPKSMWKVNGLNQLLSELQVSSHDFSQSESDSESIHTPSMSPIQKKPILEEQNKNKCRSSFGLHSPDESSMGTDAKDYNLKEYLKQLKDYSKFDDNSHDTDFAAQKLSEIYGFEVGEDTFIETDPDLIDLRSIPPPQTPDELDALSILNAAPRGFGDSSSSNRSEDSDGDLDKFLEKVIISPPTQVATSAKELTPEEIMSFIIPPPPNLEGIANRKSKEECASFDESLYSNSQRVSVKDYLNETNNSTSKHVNVSPVIEYATVERKGAFSCCAKGKKVESATNNSPIPEAKGYTEFALPPRRCTHSDSCSPPARPPKSVKLQYQFSPKKYKTIDLGVKRESSNAIDNMPLPPAIPPRYDERSLSPVVSVPPKKPPLPPNSARSVTRVTHPLLSPTQQFPTITDSNHVPANQNNIGSAFNTTQADLHHGYINERYRFNSKCNLVCSNFPNLRSPRTLKEVCDSQRQNDNLISKNGYIIDVEALLSKTDIAMIGLLAKLDQVAAQCTAGHAAGGGSNINEDMFQRAREELTDQSLALVTASKLLVVAMSDMTLTTLPEHLTSCLTAIRKITEFTEDMSRHTSSPLQTRNIVLKVHDVASNFRELVLVKIGSLGAGTLALQAECLANVLAALLRSLRVFSP